MAYKYTDTKTGIEFNDVKRIAAEVGSVPLSSRDNYQISGETITSKYDDVINAIDIDWNGAELYDGTTINTSADLLDHINKLTQLVVALYAQLEVQNS